MAAEASALMSLADLLNRAMLDPLVRSALLATVVLGLAAVAGGLARRDLVAFRRPATWLAIATSLLAALALAAAGDRLASALPELSFLQGWERVPLYLLALGYGPSIGIVAGLAMSIAGWGAWVVGPNELMLVLELAAVGWLGLGPTPRRARWAGPFAIVLGWSLATATVGLAAWAADGRPIATVPFLVAHSSALAAVASAALLAAAIPPRVWRRNVPGAADRVRLEHDHERVRWLRPLERAAYRRPSRHAQGAWPSPRLPSPSPLRAHRAHRRRRSRARTLSQPPQPPPLVRPVVSNHHVSDR